MISQFTTWVGSLAAILTTVSFLPQVYKTWKSGDTSGISLLMYSLFVTGILFWLVYGILLNELPIILANSVTLISSGIILTLKIKSMFKK